MSTATTTMTAIERCASSLRDAVVSGSAKRIDRAAKKLEQARDQAARKATRSKDVAAAQHLVNKERILKEQIARKKKADEIEADGRVISINPCIPGARGDIYDLLRVRNVMVGSSVMLRRRAFDQVGGFDENLTSIENRDLWIRVAKKWLVECIDQPLTLYRVHAGNRSENVELRRRNIFQVLAKHHEASDRSRNGRRLRREAYSHAYFNVLGRGYFRRLEMTSARRMLGRAAWLRPRLDVLRLVGLSLLGRRGFLLARALKRRLSGRDAVSGEDRSARS